MMDIIYNGRVAISYLRLANKGLYFSGDLLAYKIKLKIFYMFKKTKKSQPKDWIIRILSDSQGQLTKVTASGETYIHIKWNIEFLVLNLLVYPLKEKIP